MDYINSEKTDFSTDVLSKPVFALTVGELVDIIISRIPSDLSSQPPKQERIRIVGIRQLAKYLKSSVATVQSLKNQGKLPYKVVGNKTHFYSDEIDNALDRQTTNRYRRKSIKNDTHE